MATSLAAAEALAAIALLTQSIEFLLKSHRKVRWGRC